MKVYSILKPLMGVYLFISLSLYSRGQSGANSFPATGNASVGTSTSPNTFTVNGTLTTNGTITQTGGTVSSTSGFSTYLCTNSIVGGQSTNLSPGLVMYRDRWFDYGIDLGYNPSSSRYRTRIFSPYTADVALSYINETGTIPTAQSQLSDGLVMLGGSGNILIGKSTQTNSSYILDVAGPVRANEVVVNTSGADFVFDSTYTLPLLLDVAAYIHVNHHLPLMTPAADMQKDGVKLGDNQIKILQKVEELTLYTIDADEQIRQLKTANARQAALLEEQQKILAQQEQLLLKLQAKLEQK